MATLPSLGVTWPVALDRDYSKFANETAQGQLAKAGYRLAALLVTYIRLLGTEFNPNKAAARFLSVSLPVAQAA